MRKSQRLWFAGVSYALVWGLVVLGFLGPLALAAALATLIVASSLQLRGVVGRKVQNSPLSQ